MAVYLQQNHGWKTIGASFSGNSLEWYVWNLTERSFQKRSDGVGQRSSVNFCTGNVFFDTLIVYLIQPSRYEREVNGGSRPALRLIVARDAPAAFPLVLCVSGVSWSEPGVTEDGLPIEPHPELEVTDGWYRLRAQVDRPMARAIRKGTIKIGRKIGVAGARVCEH